MTRTIVAVALAAAATLELPAPSAERSVPFHVGEALTYDVSWSTFVAAGTAVATIKEKKPSYGSTAYYIVAEGRPTPLVAKLFPLYYKVDTLLDSFSLLSQRGSTYSEEGARHRYREKRFDRPRHDPLSALYALRTIAFKPGARMTLAVEDDEGTDYELKAAVNVLERVTTRLGETSAWRVDLAAESAGRSQVRNLVVWLSDDARRLPVKLQADLPVGSFVLLLRSAS